jgi:hypothetical protein
MSRLRVRASLLLTLLCATVATAGTATTWDFSTDPFSNDWIKGQHAEKWMSTNVTWNSASQQVELTVTADTNGKGIGGIMITSAQYGPGQIDVKAKIIASPGVASCIWTYLEDPYYSEIDLELTSAPSHQSTSDASPGALVAANDTCPGYPHAVAAAPPSPKVARYTVYNHNPNSEYRYATAWQDVTRPGVDLSQEVMRTYRIKWDGGDSGGTRRVEYWFGDGQASETFSLAFIMYDDKLQFYDDSRKSGGYPTGYYMERRFYNPNSPFPSDTIAGQTRTQGKAYAWNASSGAYVESDAFEFQNYTPGQMKPTVPNSTMPAQIYIGPWCPTWSGDFEASSAPMTMVIDSITYTPQSGSIHAADVNEDGIVNAADLDALHGVLGTCHSDSDVDGIVGIHDLLDLLSRWGACQ